MKPEHKKYILESPINKKAILISIALIIIIGFALYANSLNGKFIWDDHYLVRDNTYIRNWSNVTKIFTKDIAAGAGIEFTSYRPLQMLTYMVDYSLWKLDARGYHFTNILLHILVALCIWWLTYVLFDNQLLSLFTSMFFVTHPIHTGAVTYISGRADPLAVVFMLLCLILYIKWLRISNRGIYALMLSTYIFALLSRENSLILPFLILLYHYTFRKKFKLKGFLPMLGVTFIYILLRLTVLKVPLPHLLRGTTLFQRIPGFFAAITNCIRLLFFPVNLHMEYGNRFFSLTDPQVLSGIFITCLLLIYAFKKRAEFSLIFFSICWFFLAFLPHSNLYPIDAYMAEHWLYLPSIGFFLILANGLSYLCKNKDFRIFAAVIIITLLSFSSYLTIRQNSYWKDPIAFYERTLRFNPDSWRIHNNLGNLYSNIGDDEAAIASYRKTIEIKPDYAEGYFNLGNVYKDMGKHEEAIVSYEKVIKIKPNFAKAYNNLGVMYKDLGRIREAIASFKKALKIDPNDIYARDNLEKALRGLDETGR